MLPTYERGKSNMNASESLNKIEFLSSPNAVELITIEALEFTEANFMDASKEALFAIIQKQEQQLKAALNSLAITTADANDSQDIIKLWRAHSGFTSDEEGNILYAAPVTDTIAVH
jgi:hypothetical protein